MNKSKQQTEAVNLTNKDILVSASAGAGKTTILIERLIKRIIQDLIPINRIIAMTFTEAAASEMKKRLIVALNKIINDKDLDEDKKEFARKQLLLSDNANILTIHSFCLSIIENNFATIGLSMSSIKNIADDELVYRYKSKAFNDTMNYYLENKFEKFYQFSTYLNNSTSNIESIRDNIEKIIYTAVNTVAPLEWLDRQINEYYTIDKIEDLNPKTLGYFHKYLKDYVMYLIDNANKAIIELENYSNHIDYVQNVKNNIETNNEKLIFNKQECNNNISIINSVIDELNKLLLINDISLLNEKIYNYDINKLNDVYKKLKKIEDINTRVDLKLELDNNTINIDEYIKLHNVQVPIIISVITFCKDVYLRYLDIKKENDVLDFNDLEHYALKILKANDNAVSKYYKELFLEVIVDEFQDTNQIQNDIITLISKKGHSFRVGDLKQSIYKFRGAKPSLMDSLSKDPNTYNISLKNNYRSLNKIVEFNNSLFGNIMNTENTTIKYNEEDYQVANLDYQLVDNEDVEMFVIDSTVGDDLNKNKALFIANHIIESIKNTKFKNYNDYCILVKTHDIKKYLQEAFDNANIPYFIDLKKGYLQAYAIKVIISYLKFISDKNDKISLVSILTSSIYNVDINLLLDIKKINDINELIDICPKFVEDYTNLRSINNLFTMYNYILNINDFYIDSLNAQDKANVDLFTTLISGYNGNLNQFIIYIEKLILKDKSSSFAVNDEENVVRVMSIHQSKGLQFNVVYLLSSFHEKSKENGPLLCHADYGIGLQFFDTSYPYRYKSLEHMMVESNLKFEEKDEKLRVLYVALTRPKERLYIVDSIKKKKDKEGNIVVVKEKGGLSNLIDINTNNLKYTLTYNKEVLKLDKIESNSKDNKKIPLYGYTYNIKQNNAPSNHNNDKLYLNLSSTNYALIGTMVHKLIEIIPKDKEWNKELILELMPGFPNEYIQGVIQLKSNDLYCESLKYENYNEYQITYIKDNITTNGIIDYISFINDKIIIIDFKTDRTNDKQQYIDNYSKQLNMYKEIIKDIYKDKIVKTYIYSLTLKEMIEI